ncbi:MAG: ATP-binding protein [Rikenellaceae bacterium]
MALNDIKEYSIDDIQSLIDNGVEESVHLEFKQAGALAKTNSVIKEIAKDVSAFANSDGGVIIYGVEESDHKASALSYVDGNDFTEEWLENVISSNIQRKIDGLEVIPLRVDEEISKSIYIVKIPRSYNAPHMVSKDKDNRYYKRYNFKAALMEEYEIRDLFHRINMPKLVIAGQIVSHEIIEDGMVEYTFHTAIHNLSNIICSRYKLNLYISNIAKELYTYNCNRFDRVFLTVMNEEEVKISISHKESIYAKESIDMSKFTLSMDHTYCAYFEKNTQIRLLLLYQGGEDEIITSVKELMQ